jgi:hypothetical protein
MWTVNAPLERLNVAWREGGVTFDAAMVPSEGEREVEERAGVAGSGEPRSVAFPTPELQPA